MLKVLNVTDDKTHCGNIGHIVNNFELMCQLAHKYSFDGVNLDLHNNDNLIPQDKKLILSEYNLKPISFGFTAEIFNPDDNQYEKSLKRFIQAAADANIIGCNLALCYIPPFSHDLNFNDKFILASTRLRQLQPLIHKYNLKIGFEFIGPTETRRNSRYDFIHTIDGTRALIASSGLYGSAGYKLDIHHWQYSGATLLDLKHMDLEYILYVEINNSLSGYTLDNMPEFERELPNKTGNTDVRGFLELLIQKGYTGPIAVEPWNQKIKEMPIEKAIGEIKLALDECINLIKIS